MWHDSFSPWLSHSACVVLLACHKFGRILDWLLRCFHFWVAWHVGWLLAKLTGAFQCTHDLKGALGCVVYCHNGFVAQTFVTPAFRHGCFLSHPLWPQSINACRKWRSWKGSIENMDSGWSNMRTTSLLALFWALLLNTLPSPSSGFISYVCSTLCNVPRSVAHSLFCLLVLSFFLVSPLHLSLQWLFLPTSTVSKVVTTWFCGKRRLWRSKMAQRYCVHDMQSVLNFRSMKGRSCFFRGVLNILIVHGFAFGNQHKDMHRCAQTSTNVRLQGVLKFCVLILQQRRNVVLPLLCLVLGPEPS